MFNKMLELLVEACGNDVSHDSILGGEIQTITIHSSQGLKNRDNVLQLKSWIIKSCRCSSIDGIYYNQTSLLYLEED